MDIRLLDAAWNGNVETLRQLIEEDGKILHIAALNGGGQTPLHMACLAGNLPFVKELVTLMPDFAWELNPDGFSPLHIASAKGYVEICRELLRIDGNLCLVEGTVYRIPLHCAVIKGRLEVIRELISVFMDSFDKVTARGDTVLHLALKNNQFKAFQVLIEHLKQINKEGVVNMTDYQGNTILHLAVSRKLYQVVDFLLNEQVISKGMMDLNPQNKRGLTPLDVLKLSQSEDGDQELEDLLRKAGAKMTENFLLLPTNAENTTDGQILDTSSNGHSIRPYQLATHHASQMVADYNNYQKLCEDSTEKSINFLLVIAILILTATYQAVLRPPGGFWQDDVKEDYPHDGHTAGKAIMASKSDIIYGLFLLFNTTGFIMCMNIIYVLTSEFPLKWELRIAMLSLCATYANSVAAIGPADYALANLFYGMSIALPSGMSVTFSAVRYRSNKRRNTASGINQECA